MDTSYSLLPKHDGVLPKFLVAIALLALGNSIQAFSTMKYTSQVYAGPIPGAKSPATALSGRIFGIYTFLAALIRFNAAYHINEPAWYNLALWTFGLAGFHFSTEWLYFKTSYWQKGLIGPIIVSVVGTVWMTSQRGYYLGL